MNKMENIADIGSRKVLELINSVDIILFDIDGVLLRIKDIIPGSDQAVAKLRQLGKRIGFVTNNSLSTVETLANNLKAFQVTTDEILNPNLSLIAYLNSIRFDKSIYVIGGEVVKELLKKEGYTVLDFKSIQSEPLPCSLSAIRNLAENIRESCHNVGMVYLDVCYNDPLASIQAAQLIIHLFPNVQILSGLNDDKAPLGGGIFAAGTQYYIEGIERWTKRNVESAGKPGAILGGLVRQKFNVTDDRRVLMVGDNVLTDIAFGVKCGFKTLLVLSGIWTEDDLKNWTLPEDLKPNYVASKLDEILNHIN